MKLDTAAPWWSDVLLGLYWDAEPSVVVHLGPWAVTFEPSWIPPEFGRDLPVGHWFGWHVYLCVNINLWVVGWHWVEGDRGFYFGPANLQMEVRRRGW